MALTAIALLARPMVCATIYLEVVKPLFRALSRKSIGMQLKFWGTLHMLLYFSIIFLIDKGIDNTVYIPKERLQNPACASIKKDA